MNHWNKDKNQVGVTEKLVIRSLKILDQRFMKTDKTTLRLPKELKDLVVEQNAHHASVQQNIAVQWRDYFLAEIPDDLKNNHHFYETQMEVYQDSELKRIITRFELLLHSFLRDFVKQSIDDWVGFIKSFTKPNYDRGELWELSQTQMITIHLSIHNKRKKKDDKNKKKDAKAEKEEKDDIPDNSIVFKPSLEECADFFTGAFDKIIEATNKIEFLEFELMPFLKNYEQNEDSDDENNKESQKKEEEEKKLKENETPLDPETGERLGPRRGPNFKLDREFPWIENGIAEVNRMISENVDAPIKLLNQYKEYEVILRTSKKEKVASLFDPKKPIEEIRAALEFYEKTYFDILNTSNNYVDFPIFKIEAKNLKEKLSEQAEKIKQSILEATHDYCIKTVNDVIEEYKFMKEKIGTDPKDEEILVEVREFIKDSPNKVANLELKVNEVGKHMLLLEDYSFYYNDKEYLRYWNCKRWPLEISTELTFGSQHIEKQEEIFMYRLENEKEEFKKQLKIRQETLGKIKKFKNLDDSKNFAADCSTLEKALFADSEKVARFNVREGLFNLEKSEYPDLDAIIEEFQPYNKLIPMAYEISWNFKEWMTQQFDKLPPFGEIETTIISSRSL